jgi:plasmid stability protein
MVNDSFFRVVSTMREEGRRITKTRDLRRREVATLTIPNLEDDVVDAKARARGSGQSLKAEVRELLRDVATGKSPEIWRGLADRIAALTPEVRQRTALSWSAPTAAEEGAVDPSSRRRQASSRPQPGDRRPSLSLSRRP